MKKHEQISMKTTILFPAVILCSGGILFGCGSHHGETDSLEAPSIQNRASGTGESTSAETASETENEAPAENQYKVSAQEAADTFGIEIVLPENSNWIEDEEYYFVDEDNLRVTYHDLIADADCTLLVSKNDSLNLPPAEYDETLNETWEGSTIGGQHITVSVQHERNHEKMTLAVWEYKEYQFALMGEDDSDAVIPKVALNIIQNLD